MAEPQSARAGKVYFVRRSQCEVPLGHRVTEFSSDTVLGWFQDQWIRGELRSELLNLDPEEDDLDGRLYQHADELLHGGVYGFHSVFRAMLNWGEQPPDSVAALKEFIATIDYYGEITFLEGAIQCVTDDDEIEISWLLFDEGFALANPDRVAFLLQREWRLSADAGKTGARILDDIARELAVPTEDSSSGVTYAVFLSALDGMTITEMTGAFRFEGVRLPTFAAALRAAKVRLRKKDQRNLNHPWPEELILLRALAQFSEASGLAELLREQEPGVLNDRLSPARAFSELRYSLKKPAFLAGDQESCAADFAQLADAIKKSRAENRSVWSSEMMPPLIQTSDHLCQIRFHQHLTSEGYGAVDYGWTYLFFDDLWAAANRELAQSIVHYARGWQVLYEAEPLVSR